MSFEQFERDAKLPIPRVSRANQSWYPIEHYHDNREHPVWHWLRIIICLAAAAAIGWMAAKGIA